MRSQNFPVSESDVLEQIATIDLYDAVDEILTGGAKPCPLAIINSKFALYKRNFRPTSSIIFPAGEPNGCACR